MSLLFTDLYELTMAQGYWAAGQHEDTAVFHLSYRDAPPGAHAVLACGQADIADWLADWRATPDDLAYLRGLTGNDGQPLFRHDFLAELASTRLACDIDAVAEGTAVSPGMPILRVTGPLWQAQILETGLLNRIGHASLIATQAAQLAEAAGDAPVLEFGLRRAQGPDGGHTASRAAYIGGCSATSNLVAGQRWDIPVRGTHAHAWVQAFDDEITAFRAYAGANPGNVILLVDTYDTATGIDNAITVGRELARDGLALHAIRLDSGDLDHWSRHARQALDAAGLTDTRIVASGGLDAASIAALRSDNAPIDMWGVGTRLVTGGDHPALDTTYKLGALRRAGAREWSPRMKISADPAKRSLPGILQIHRSDPAGGDTVYSTLADARRPSGGTDLLRPWMRGGQLVNPPETVHVIRDRARRQRALVLDASYTANVHPDLAAQAEALCARLT